MVRRRLALLFAALPLSLYAYACTDDGGGPVPNPNADSGSQADSGPVEDSATDAGSDATTTEDAGSDAGDGGVSLVCIGNPLTADGGTADGGMVVVDPDGGALKVIGTGPFLDGPQWIGDALVYSEVNSQSIVRTDPDGGARVVLNQTGTTTLPIGNARVGNFLFTTLSEANGNGAAILRMQLDGGSPLVFDAGGPANSPNDAVGSAKGFIYFTDPAFQSVAANPITGVYRMGVDGGITNVQQFNGGANPGARADGIALTSDGTTLYVGFFDEKRIARYTVDAAGVASAPQNLTFTPIDNPTGLAVDTGGNLWIAENDPGQLQGRIEVIDSTGKKWGEIPFPDSHPTGIAFGGADGRTVYITTERGNENAALYVLTTRCPGVP